MPHKLGKVKHTRVTPINKKKKTFVKTQLASTLLLNGWSTTCIFCKFSLFFLYFKQFNHSPTKMMSAPALDHILSIIQEEDQFISTPQKFIDGLGSIPSFPF